MKQCMSFILLTGTLLAGGFVLIGGIFFLWQHGSAPLRSELIYSSHFHVSFTEMWYLLQHNTAVGLIELGLISLVMTQLLRVALLCWFYTVTRDIPFAAISIFILGVLIYSTLWHQL
jgi:uncharacterized membrane protein